MSKIIATLYAVMDKRPLRALSFVMALLLAGCMFWDPSRFAAKPVNWKSGMVYC